VEIVGDSVRNHTYEEGTSNTEIAQDARVMDSQGSTVYMAMGGYAPETVARYKGRTAENAQWFRSLWYDLDVGESKDYKTLKEAGDALVSFVNTVGLPPPTLVHSGHGLHAYWPLDEDLPIADWRTAASKFMALAHQHGLRIDTTCTADAARILRPIGTHNYKAEPKLVSLIQRNNAVPFTQLQTYLASVKVATTTLVRVNGNHPKSKPIDAFGLGSIDKARPENFSASKIIAGCLQFQWALNNQPDVKEPVWRAMIGTLYRTDDRLYIRRDGSKGNGMGWRWSHMQYAGEHAPGWVRWVCKVRGDQISLLLRVDATAGDPTNEDRRDDRHAGELAAAWHELVSAFRRWAAAVVQRRH
jgi:hypothetical protein